MILKAKKEVINNVFQILVENDYDSAKSFVIALSKENGICQKRIIPIEDVYEVKEDNKE